MAKMVHRIPRFSDQQITTLLTAYVSDIKHMFGIDVHC